MLLKLFRYVNMFSRRIKKLMFSASILSIPLIGIGTFLVSCSSTSATKMSKNNFQLYINEPTDELLRYTISEWMNKFTNHDYDEFQISIAHLLVQNNINFKFDELTQVNVNKLSTSSNSPILQNVNFTFINSNSTLSININNMLVFSDDYFDKPDLSIVNNPISINQKDLPQIYNTNPTLVLDSEWINSINAISPNNTIYIPNNIYYLKNREFTSVNNYELTFSINMQYSSMVNLEDYPDIIFNIKVSDDINKNFQENFTMNPNDVIKFFGTIDKEEILSMNNKELFNILSNYVLNLDNVAPLVNCLDQNNTLYNYLIINQDISNSILIQFSSNPKTIDSTIYFYKFLLKF